MPKQPRYIFHPERLLATIACLAAAGLGVNLISAAFKGEDAKQSAEPTTAVTTQSQPISSPSIKPQPLATATLAPEKSATSYCDAAYNFLQQEGIEGFRSKPYLDINENLTIGVGFKISKDSPIPWHKYPHLKKKMTREDAEYLFNKYVVPDVERKIQLYLSREDKQTSNDPQLQARWKMLPDGIKTALFAEAYQKGYYAFKGEENRALRENLWAGIEALEQHKFTIAAKHFEEVAELIKNNPLDNDAYKARHQQTAVFMEQSIQQLKDPMWQVAFMVEANSSQQAKLSSIDLKGFVTQAMRGMLGR